MAVKSLQNRQRRRDKRMDHWQQPVSNYLEEHSKISSVYVVHESDSLDAVLSKLLIRENLEDVVAVCGKNSPDDSVKGIISDIDLLLKLQQNEENIRNGGKPIQEMNALELSNRDFFSVSVTDCLEKAVEKMSINNVNHVIALDNDLRYVGWVTKRKIHDAIASGLRT